MTPNTANQKPSEDCCDDRSRRAEAEEATRELERIRASYMSIRSEERERLDRIIEGWKGN